MNTEAPVSAKVWHAGPNYLVGGWWIVTDLDDPEHSHVADCFDEVTARHIADLHNRAEDQGTVGGGS